MIEKKGLVPEIKEAFSSAKRQRLTGRANASVILTPSSVTRFQGESWLKLIIMGGASWKPKFMETRYQFIIDPKQGAIDLRSGSWKTDYDKQKISVGLYQGGIKFPEICCKCGRPHNHKEIVEYCTAAGVPGKYRFEDKIDKETNILISTAIFSNRFWYAIPFCENHGLNSRCINIWDDPISDKIIIDFTNKDFAKRVGELNKINHSESSILHRLSPFIGFAGILMMMPGGINLFLKFKGGESKAKGIYSHLFDPMVSTFLFIFGLAIAGWGTYFYLSKRVKKF